MTNDLPDIGGLQVAGLVCLLFAQVYLQIALKSPRERHYFLLSGAACVIGLRLLFAHLAPTGTPYYTPAFVPHALLGVGGAGLLWAGLLWHLGLPPMRRRQLMVYGLAPYSLVIIAVWLAVLAGLKVPRAPVVMLTYLTFLVLVPLGWSAERREPGVGHRVVSITLAVVCLLLPALLAAGYSGSAVLLAGAAPLLVLLVTVLPTAFLREQRRLSLALDQLALHDSHLQRANEGLEQWLRQRNQQLQLALAAAEHPTATQDRMRFAVGQDISAPLKALDDLLAVLSRSMLGPVHQQLAQAAQRSVKDLAAQVGRSIDDATLAEGDVSVSEGLFDPNRLVAQVVQEFQRQARQSGVALRLQAAPQNPLLTGDPRRISQVLRKLIDNALKFTEAGSVEVSLDVQADPDAPTRRLLRFSVRDTAIGMSPASQDGLFWQGSSGGETPFVSARSGSAMAAHRALCVAMGGGMSLSSQLAVGTEVCFWVRCTCPVPD